MQVLKCLIPEVVVTFGIFLCPKLSEIKKPLTFLPGAFTST